MRFRRSPAQIAAARRGGVLSKGSVVPEGKQVCAQSSRKHGVYAKAILLNDRFKPRNPVENMHVQRMLVAQWRYLRVWIFDQAGIISKLDDDPDQNPTLAHLESFLDLDGASQKLHSSPLRTAFSGSMIRPCQASPTSRISTNYEISNQPSK